MWMEGPVLCVAGQSGTQLLHPRSHPVLQPQHPTFGRQVNLLYARQVGHGAVPPRSPHPEGLLPIAPRFAGAAAAGPAGPAWGRHRGRLYGWVPQQLAQDLGVGRLDEEAVLLEHQLDLRE